LSISKNGLAPNTYFVGHSMGCQAILRYAQSLGKDENIGGVVFVAGWMKLKGLTTQEEEEVAAPWIENAIDYQMVRSKIDKSVAIFSDDDPFVSLENSKIYKENVGSKIITEKGKGHYTEDVTKKIPVALKELLEIMK